VQLKKEIANKKFLGMRLHVRARTQTRLHPRSLYLYIAHNGIALKPELASISRRWRVSRGAMRKRQGLAPSFQVPAKLVGVIC